MGLADLKKNASLCKSTNNIAVSIDDFIAAADLYAAGQNRPQHEEKQTLMTSDADKQNNIIDFLQRKYPQHVEPIKSVNKSKQQPYRRCTYTLSETAIRDRKSTRLNSSHQINSYAVFCLKKKKESPHNILLKREASDTHNSR